MSYNPKLGAMSSPFGENANEGSIMKEDPNALPPREDIVGVKPSTLSDMMNKAWDEVIGGHDKAQDALMTNSKPKQPEQDNSKKDRKQKMISEFVQKGINIVSVSDNEIEIEVGGVKTKVQV